jgi:uncharacterized protein (DUF433 family)
VNSIGSKQVSKSPHPAVFQHHLAYQVSAIFENLEVGANIDDIMEWFDGLDREQVKAVIEFAARSLDKVPVYAP